MPELPEVETICRGLDSCITGHRFCRVELFRPDLRIPFPPHFVERLEGRRITTIRRRAKYILISLEGATVLIIHLGMSGKMLVYPAPRNRPALHDHVLFRMDDGKEVAFNDPRRFGLMAIADSLSLDSHPLLAKLGIEPLEDSFTTVWLAGVFMGRKMPVKTLLMDSSQLVGIGNIYACESLFRAGISPLRAAGNLQKGEIAKLVPSIRETLEAALLSGGSTLRDYVRSTGDSGYFQHQFAVYGREGKPCHSCGRMIIRIRQAGRSTFYCSVCQE